MFDRRLFFTCLAITVTALISVLLSNISVPAPEFDNIAEASPPTEQVQATTDTEERPEEEYKYILKNHNGHIAVFVPGKEEPEIVLDTMVKFLPDYDRLQMETGIPVKDYSALTAIVEDYIS